jgi:ATP-dependent DNA ligase
MLLRSVRSRLNGFIEPCLPSPALELPARSGSIHEIKHDGFRLLARRDAGGVRLFTPVFDRLRYGRQQKTEAVLFAFDLLELAGHLRRDPLEERKWALAKLLKRASWSLHLNDHIDEPGDIVFRHACKLGFEGIVSKRLGSPYRSGRSRIWLKFKNPAVPAVRREAEEDWAEGGGGDQ